MCGGKRYTEMILVEKIEGKKSLGQPMRKRQGNVKVMTVNGLDSSGFL
jgi:hypothetical protein